MSNDLSGTSGHNKAYPKAPTCGKKNSVFLFGFLLSVSFRVFFCQNGYLVRYVQQIRWWFQMFLTFTPNLGEMIQFDQLIFFNWGESTSKQQRLDFGWGKKIIQFEGTSPQTCKKIREQKKNNVWSPNFQKLSFFSQLVGWAAVQVSRFFFLGGGIIPQ